GDRLDVNAFFGSDVTGNYRLEQIRFDDGTTWDLATIKARALDATDGDDSLTGYSSADTIQGALGNDSLSGGGGNDTIDGGDGDDTLSGGDGNDNHVGGAGMDSLSGNAGDDTLDGGAGNDTLDGGAGSDTYLFGRGSGVDFISAYDTTAGKLDVVQLGAGITPADIQLIRSNDVLSVVIVGAGDRLDVNAFFGSDVTGNQRIEQIRFADGTTWDLAAIKARALDATDRDDSLTGYNSADTVQGALGNDSLSGGGGNDTIDGGDGEDTCWQRHARRWRRQ
ncbi:calcium-binding protein, partial [Rhizobacter sp. Root1221]|uniref:calcium-binding protein n=1 Tax=Rhizobacter sp. Root1221 TaxID=1736433 RepID=UPI000A9965FA